MGLLTGKRIVLGVTGGIAAYKSAELTRLLVKAGATVDVVLTEAGAQFVGATTFQALSGRPVWTSLWDERMPNAMAHIDLTRGAELLLVAPASADILARMAADSAERRLARPPRAVAIDCARVASAELVAGSAATGAETAGAFALGAGAPSTSRISRATWSAMGPSTTCRSRGEGRIRPRAPRALSTAASTLS